MKGTKKFFIIHYSLFISAALALSACSDWDDHYQQSANVEGGNVSIWQQMEANPQLSDFRDVLSATKVFRHHKKTVVSYADLLKGGQSFTVVAPVNGTFNKDSLLRLVETAQGDSAVEKQFVMNHISRSTTSVMPNAQRVLMLNGKHSVFEANNIEGVAITEKNIHAENGVVHVVNNALPYRYNLYEALNDLPEFRSIGTFLRQYEEDYFDADASVSSGIIEGVPVYVDSVVIELNKMLSRIGLINAEDSSYTVVAPTSEGWQTAWDVATQYFKYDETVLKRDSVQNYWTNRALLDDAVFNNNLQDSPLDSLKSVQYYRYKPKWHVFYKPFAEGGILAGATPIACSNGTLYRTSQWPFTPETTFFREIWAEGENTSLITAERECTYSYRSLVADSISENAYLDILPEKQTSNWELTYRVSNTLSGTYDICAIILPQSVAGRSTDKPCKFKATINYVDEKGKEQSFVCNNNTALTSNAERVDTVVLAENFRFPVCNYDQNNLKVTVKLSCSILARETARYSREMYLDCIYLRPKQVNSEE